MKLTRLSQLLEAPKVQVSGDAAAIVEKASKLITRNKPIKFPKIPREMINDAIKEAVVRMNAAGTGNAHDVAFPYESVFGINVKAQSISKNLKGEVDLELCQSPVFKQYMLAAREIAVYGAEAEAYGKFVYAMIITIWSWLKDVHRTDPHAPPEEDIFAMKLALKALGVNIVKPR